MYLLIDCQRSSGAPFASGFICQVSDIEITGTPKAFAVRAGTNLYLALLIGLCLQTAGCVGIPSAPGAERVKMTHKEEDVEDCTPLGPVVGLTDSNYVSDERREMQNQAVDLGADTLLLTREKDPPKGTAYRCKPSTTKADH